VIGTLCRKDGCKVKRKLYSRRFHGWLLNVKNLDECFNTGWRKAGVTRHVCNQLARFDSRHRAGEKILAAHHAHPASYRSKISS